MTTGTGGRGTSGYGFAFIDEYAKRPAVANGLVHGDEQNGVLLGQTD